MTVTIPLLTEDDEYGTVTVVTNREQEEGETSDPKKDFDPRLIPEPQLQEITPWTP